MSHQRDELFDAAVEWARDEGRVSVSMLQRRLVVGYTRATRIIKQLIDAGVVEPYTGSRWLRTLPSEEARR
jgi:S-DNA-T family DNA segregation ATPase FtsK/SpoIIIE